MTQASTAAVEAMFFDDATLFDDFVSAETNEAVHRASSEADDWPLGRQFLVLAAATSGRNRAMALAVPKESSPQTVRYRIRVAATGEDFRVHVRSSPSHDLRRGTHVLDLPRGGGLLLFAETGSATLELTFGEQPLEP